MADSTSLDALPLPKSWPDLAKRATLAAVSMIATAWVSMIADWSAKLSPRARALAEIERRDAEIARLKERLRIVTARLAKVPAKNRPHYAPADRLAILEIRAAEGWCAERTAREFLVDGETVRGWMAT
jgi:acetyl-CoA acetyltransferase